MSALSLLRQSAAETTRLANAVMKEKLENIIREIEDLRDELNEVRMEKIISDSKTALERAYTSLDQAIEYIQDSML